MSYFMHPCWVNKIDLINNKWKYRNRKLLTKLQWKNSAGNYNRDSENHLLMSINSTFKIRFMFLTSHGTVDVICGKYLSAELTAIRFENNKMNFIMPYENCIWWLHIGISFIQFRLWKNVIITNLYFFIKFLVKNVWTIILISILYNCII